MINKIIEHFHIDNPAEVGVMIFVVLFAVTFHEYAHGKAAFSLGDPTAKKAGRLTLNPISHIDPIGAICMFLFHFGWAKPVPINPAYFANKRKDIILMALSGPVSNIGLAVIAGIFIRFYILPNEIYLMVLYYMLVMNIGLGLFNLLPIPPLDGSHVLENILPPSASRKFIHIRRYAPIVLIALLLLDHYLNLNFLGKILGYPMSKLAILLGGENFLELHRFMLTLKG